MQTAPNPTSNKPLLFGAAVFTIVSAFALGLMIGGTTGMVAVGGNNLPFDEGYVRNVVGILNEEYISDLPGKDALTHGVAKGLIDSLGDQYSGFLTPEEAESYYKSNGSEYEGIGVQLGFDGQYTIVETPIEGFPGAEAGLLTEDVILSVDNEDMSGIRPEVVATKIRGEAGTKVMIKIYRESVDKILEFEITRKAIDLENIEYKDLGDSIYLIDIKRFTESDKGLLSGAQVFNQTWDNVVAEVSAKQPKGLVIDLRNNPGGYVGAVQHVAEEFLADGQIIMREYEKKTGEEVFRDSRNGAFEAIPLVVLVNSASASSAEILAAAIQENGRGQVVGTSTVGKGVEQKLITLDDGALIMLVFRNWLTPKGNQIDAEHPIKPDFELEYVEPGSRGFDNQTEKAIELLTK